MPLSHKQTAEGTSFDPTGTALTAEDAQTALEQVEALGAHLKQHRISTDFAVPAGNFAVWVDYLEIADTVLLEIEDTGSLEIT